MNIDRSNYESYLIDYIDGNLSEEFRRKMGRFLAANPDILEEFEAAKGAQFDSYDLPSIDKTNFFQSFSDIPSISDAKFEEFCIAYYEGDLDPISVKKLHELNSVDEEKKKLFELYASIHFSSDPDIQYPHQNQLKKYTLTPVRRFLYIASAGVAALIIGLLIFVSQQADRDIKLQAENPVHHNSQLVPGEQKLHIEATPVPEQKKQSITQAYRKSKPEKYLASIDTSSPYLPETIILASIEPINIALRNDQISDVYKIFHLKNQSLQSQSQINHQPKLPENIPFQQQTRIINRKTVFWSAVQVGIRGYNSLTENDLALDTKQNRNGKLTGITIQAEDFEFQRKFKKNIQN